MLEEVLDETLSRQRYMRRKPDVRDNKPGALSGHRKRMLTDTFGKTDIDAPPARLARDDGKSAEGKSKSLRAHQRSTKTADALIDGAYLAGTNTCSVRNALQAVFRQKATSISLLVALGVRNRWPKGVAGDQEHGR